ncbi:MAG: hypothetical protein CMI58_01760 [Parcubacteria group bacterium]|jgi:ribose/xylose/arabinose/galactoside ABC-type transport system permease subunit|nr:hypothetical protein [Parcubacteria group bacterium]|tara:strand:+ start:284 stop:607 length:324 start_codon:yes stop_codon:yes gene_type:complete
MKILIKSLSLYFVPVLAFAVAAPTDFNSLVNIVVKLMGKVIPIIVALTLLGFFWGIAQFILNADKGKVQDKENKDLGKGTMFWGVIILFVMLSIWGIIGLLQTSFGV